MKRVLVLFYVIIVLVTGGNAQTLSTDTFNDTNGNVPAVGANFNVPIDVTGINTIYTLTVYLEYDPEVLSFTGSTNSVPNTTVTEQPGTDNVIKVLVGNFPNTTTINDGKLVDLQFDFLAGNSDLTFHTEQYGAYSSKIFTTSGSFYYFTDSDVTNGAVEGGYVDNTISGGDWHTTTDWSLDVVPNSWHNVVVAVGSETTISADAVSNDLTVQQGGALTLNNPNSLDVNGDFLIESTDSGNGSFINNGTLAVTGTSSAQCYVMNGQWHGISAPVSGETFNALYRGGSPEVWAKSYNELDSSYTYIADLSTPMNDMQGYMTFIETGTGANPQTFTFDGQFRTGTVGSANNMVHESNGFNFVGNPFTSAIDWDAASGWNTTNLNGAIYVYNGPGPTGPTWATYVPGTGTNGGSRFISMNQGFFVQVLETAGSGSLTMDEGVCVHNDVDYMKSQIADQQIIRLQLKDDGKTDETVIRFIDGATAEYDADFDAHKLFSFNEDYPQIYSTSNNFMSINSLPFDATGSIALDVKGEHGNNMTITPTEANDFEDLFLKDELTGDLVNIKGSSYEFDYDGGFTDRFTLFFSITDVNESTAAKDDDLKIFAYNRNINVVLKGTDNVKISVFNILGQEIITRSSNSSITRIAIDKPGYYLVQVNRGNFYTTEKIVIK